MAWLPTYLPTYLPTCLPAHPPNWLPTSLLTYSSSYLPGYLPAHLLIFLPASLLTYSPAGLPTCLPTHLQLRIYCPSASLQVDFTVGPQECPVYWRNNDRLHVQKTEEGRIRLQQAL